MATDYLFETLGIGAPNPLEESVSGSTANGQLWAQLNGWIANLPSAQRTKVLDAISKWGLHQRAAGFTFGVGPGGASLQDLQSLASTLQTSFGTPTTPVPGSPPAQAKPAPPLTGQQQKEAAQTNVQSTADSAATTVTAQLPDTAFAPSGEGIPVVGSSGSPIPGTKTPNDFNSLLQNFYTTEFQQAANDPNALAQLAGTTPDMLQQQYQAYQQGWNKVTQPGVHGRNVNDPSEQPMTLQQFAQNKAQSMVGPWASVLAAISGIYESQFQQPLPPELANQIISALNGMPPSQQENTLYWASQYMLNKAQAVSSKGLFDQTGSMASSLLGTLPSSILTYTAGAGTGTGSLGTGGLVGTYAQLHPSAFLQGETIQTQIAQDFQQKLNRAPTTADLAALGSDPTPAAIAHYIDNQPMPGTNMTYGAYTTISGQVTPQWQQYFGKDPTNAQLAYFVGKSPTEVNDYFNNSMSSIPGITIGQKNDYLSFIQQLDSGYGSPSVGGITHVFSSQVDDSMMNQLHQQVTAQSTGKPTPGPMK